MRSRPLEPESSRENEKDYDNENGMPRTAKDARAYLRTEKVSLALGSGATAGRAVIIAKRIAAVRQRDAFE
jgi:hypothetical protein